MPSPADREVEAREDLDRLARTFYHVGAELATGHGLEHGGQSWDELSDQEKDLLRAVFRHMLLTDTIRVGKRPATLDDMFPGQRSIDDELTGSAPD